MPKEGCRLCCWVRWFTGAARALLGEVGSFRVPTDALGTAVSLGGVRGARWRIGEAVAVGLARPAALALEPFLVFLLLSDASIWDGFRFMPCAGCVVGQAVDLWVLGAFLGVLDGTANVVDRLAVGGFADAFAVEDGFGRAAGFRTGGGGSSSKSKS